MTRGFDGISDGAKDELFNDSPYGIGDYASFSDEDDAAEVDAVFRSQRRIAFGYFAVFLLVTLGAGIALIGLRWTSYASIFGGFTPGFAIAGFGLYVFFVGMAAAVSSLANGVEDRMMGARSLARSSSGSSSTATNRPSANRPSATTRASDGPRP